ncbi:hypothetical protein [Bacillus haynesii]|nr:hypothetical protein [Bacillus haynesii]
MMTALENAVTAFREDGRRIGKDKIEENFLLKWIVKTKQSKYT